MSEWSKCFRYQTFFDENCNKDLMKEYQSDAMLIFFFLRKDKYIDKVPFFH
jgi:hypothetical protein